MYVSRRLIKSKTKILRTNVQIVSSFDVITFNTTDDLIEIC